MPRLQSSLGSSQHAALMWLDHCWNCATVSHGASEVVSMQAPPCAQGEEAHGSTRQPSQLRGQASRALSVQLPGSVPSAAGHWPGTAMHLAKLTRPVAPVNFRTGVAQGHPSQTTDWGGGARGSWVRTWVRPVSSWCSFDLTRPPTRYYRHTRR